MYDHREQILGNYRLIRLLGRGGSAEVYLGEHIYLSIQAAIKVLQGRVTGEIESSFLREAQIIARLEHPHIVRILDFGIENQVSFLVMSYAPNGTLRQRHQEGSRLPLTTIVSYLKQVAAALQYAHEQNVIHCDVKPQNMLIGLNDEILLSDFGLATVSQNTSFQDIQNRAGTLLYMAPEQLQGKACLASDQYALGIVVYEWLCGKCPFQGTYTEVTMQQQLASPPSLREQVPTISSTLEQVVLKALAKEPELRFASVQEFTIAFEEATRTPEQFIMTTSTIQKSSLPLIQSLIINPWKCLSRTKVVILIGLMLLIISGVAGVVYLDYISPAGEAIFSVDAQHTHFNPYEQIINSRRISHMMQYWSASTGNIINFSPCVANGIIYVGSGDGKLYAFVASTGHLLWVSSIGAIASSSPVVTNGIVYIGSYGGKLLAFDASDGKPRWTALVGNGPVSDPIVANDIIYTSFYGGSLSAFNATTGLPRWATHGSDDSASDSVIADGIVYTVSRSGKLLAFDAFTGKQRWIASTNGGSDYFSLTVAHSIVYLGSYDGKLLAFAASTGKYLWTASGSYDGVSGLAIAYGIVYLGTYDGKLLAFVASTGKYLWTIILSNAALFSPTVANGIVYIGSQDNKLFAVASFQGKHLWSASAGGVASTPIVANGVVYVGSYDGNLYAFHLASTTS